MRSIPASGHLAVLIALPLLVACGGDSASQAQAPKAPAQQAAAGAQGAANITAPAAQGQAGQGQTQTRGQGQTQGQSQTMPAQPAQPGQAMPAAPLGAPAQNQPIQGQAAAAPAQAMVFQIVPAQSKATFAVREQLAGKNLPNDAVGSTSAIAGQIAIEPNGTIVPQSSKITIEMGTLTTDQPMRDNFIKRSTLAVQQYPTAEFVPTAAQGLPSPLPTSGAATFKLAGQMTIHGVQKEIVWDVNATRQGNTLTGTATTDFKFEDFGMTPPKAPAVLSVVDNVHLEVQLTATLAS